MFLLKILRLTLFLLNLHKAKECVSTERVQRKHRFFSLVALLHLYQETTLLTVIIEACVCSLGTFDSWGSLS